MHLLDLETQALTLPRGVDALLAGRCAHHEMVGQCMNAGSSITPSVPAMRAVQVSGVRIAAFTTPSRPPAWCSTAADVLVDAGVPT